MALLQVIAGFTHLPGGFRNRDLRPQVAALLGRPYTPTQMTYAERRDLSHPEDPSLYRDHLWPQGRVLLQQALSAHPPAQWNALLPESDHLPRPLRTALDQLDAEIRKLHEEAAFAA